MDIRLIAFDMDGTLLGERSAILEINRRALRALEKKGVKLVFNSGRSFQKLREFAQTFGVRPAICSANGARVDLSPEGPTIFEWPYPEAVARELGGMIAESGLYFNVDAPGRVYLGNSAAGRRLPVFNYQWGQSIPPDFEVVDDEERMWKESMGAVYKYSVYGEALDPRFEPIRQRAESLGLEVCSSNASNLEIMRPGADKGSCLKRVAERLKVPRESVMAFGDNLNDLPMLQYAGIPVAMENGESVAKEMARFIAPHHASGGVGRFLMKNVLEEEL